MILVQIKTKFCQDEINYFISYGVAFIQTRSMDIGNWIIFFGAESGCSPNKSWSVHMGYTARYDDNPCV